MSNTKINTLRSLLLCVATFASFFALAIVFNSSTVSANGINEQINFQGRLFTSEGATVPDGFYNIQFKIYSGGDGQTADNPGGTLLWTEDRLNDSDEGVTVQNGFLSVSLGSIEPFGSAIDWNNDTLWLSINIAGTGTTCSTFGDCGPDGEMLPMKRLTATPYSLNSAMLGGIPSGGFLQLAQGMQTDSAAGASIQIDKTGTGDFMHLQADGVDVFSLTRAGNVVFGGDDDHSISVAEASTGEGRSLTVSAGAAALGSDLDGGDLVLRGGDGDGVGEDGSVRVESVLELSVLGAADNDTIVCHNSSNQLANCVSTFANEAYVTLQNAYDNGGNTIMTSSSSGDVAITLANDTSDPSFLIDIEAGSTGRFAVQDDGTDVLGVTSSEVTINGNLVSTGNAVFQSETDGVDVFQLQNSSGTTLFSLDSTQNESLLRVGGSGSELTLFTLDTYAGTPPTGVNASLIGSMYFDTDQNRIQCYDGAAWGECGAAAVSGDITLTPEYPGAVLNGGDTPGIGTMTADFCSNDVDLSIGDLCAPGESRNFYRWTSPQATMQTYGIFVTHKLPPSFDEFVDSNTIRLTWLTDSAGGTNGSVAYQVFRRSNSGGVTACGSESTETSPSADVWHTTYLDGDENDCGFSANDYIIFKINVSAMNNANVYVEDLEFTYVSQ